jgi:hypothetical protein
LRAKRVSETPLSAILRHFYALGRRSRTTRQSLISFSPQVVHGPSQQLRMSTTIGFLLQQVRNSTNLFVYAFDHRKVGSPTSRAYPVTLLHLFYALPSRAASRRRFSSNRRN